MKRIKVVVAVTDSNGRPDFWSCIVTCTEEQQNRGEHYDAAEDAAAEVGYEPYLSYDETDPGFAMLKVAWESQLPVVTI